MKDVHASCKGQNLAMVRFETTMQVQCYIFEHSQQNMSWSISSTLLVLTTGLCLSPQLLHKTHPLTKLALAYGVYQLLRLDQASHEPRTQITKTGIQQIRTESVDMEEETIADDTVRQSALANNVTRVAECSCEVCRILNTPRTF